MLMPLVVRLTDSEIDVIDSSAPQASNIFEDLRIVIEEVCAIRLSIYNQALLPDLHVEPVYRNAKLSRELGRG